MLKRKFTGFLLDWRTKKKNECLLIKGARQVGKTYIVEEFGKTQYKSFIKLNFYEHPEYSKIFEGTLSAEEIYKRMSLYIPEIKFIEKNTLIMLDEIQECPNARTAMKFLAIDSRYDVIATGSLLGIQFKDISSIPVGYERQITMHSLDFEEFLWALGVSEESIAYLGEFYEKKEQIPEAVNGKILSYLRIYMAVGGMPEAVNEYIKTGNFGSVHEVQQKILDSYKDDVLKYASNSEKPKIKACFESIPRQLAKENTKFQYSVVKKGDTAKKYSGSIDWIVSANIADKIHNVSLPVLPLSAYEREEQFKIYVHDIGLLIAMYGFEMKAAVVDDTLTGPAKGGIYENLIHTMLARRGYKSSYFHADNNSQEIEFLVEKNGSVIPIEVKSHRGTTVSLNTFIDTFNPPYAYKLITGNIGIFEKKITLPLYMAMFI